MNIHDINKKKAPKKTPFLLDSNVFKQRKTFKVPTKEGREFFTSKEEVGNGGFKTKQFGGAGVDGGVSKPWLGEQPLIFWSRKCPNCKHAGDMVGLGAHAMSLTGVLNKASAFEADDVGLGEGVWTEEGGLVTSQDKPDRQEV